MKRTSLIMVTVLSTISTPALSEENLRPTSPVGPPVQPVELHLPVACEIGRTCQIQNYVDADATSNARDYACGTRTYDGHNGTDFRPPDKVQARTVSVLAAARGRVRRVRDGEPDQSVRNRAVDQVRGRECGNGVILQHEAGWETQYCHLRNGSVRVKPGETVEPGQAMGLVGLSGKTEFPHLHFTLRRHGKTVDPFAFGAAEGSCEGGELLWATAIRQQLTYRLRAVLNAGFAGGPVTMAAIEDASVAPATRLAPALVAFVRLIGGQAGDVQTLTIRGPDKAVIARSTSAPLDRSKAQVMMFVGKRAVDGWPAGDYEAIYFVENDGSVVVETSFRVHM